VRVGCYPIKLLIIDYTLDEDGQMTVNNQTALYYRYPDMTAIAEALFGFIQVTVEFPEKL